MAKAGLKVLEIDHSDHREIVLADRHIAADAAVTVADRQIVLAAGQQAPMIEANVAQVEKGHRRDDHTGKADRKAEVPTREEVAVERHGRVLLEDVPAVRIPNHHSQNRRADVVGFVVSETLANDVSFDTLFSTRSSNIVHRSYNIQLK
jgi:hypothetical protein